MKVNEQIAIEHGLKKDEFEKKESPNKQLCLKDKVEIKKISKVILQN